MPLYCIYISYFCSDKSPFCGSTGALCFRLQVLKPGWMHHHLCSMSLACNGSWESQARAQTTNLSHVEWAPIHLDTPLGQYLLKLFHEIHKIFENFNLCSWIRTKCAKQNISTDAITFTGKICKNCRGLLNFLANSISPVNTMYTYYKMHSVLIWFHTLKFSSKFWWFYEK